MEQQDLFLKMIEHCYHETELKKGMENGEKCYQTEIYGNTIKEMRTYRIRKDLTEEMKKNYSDVRFVYEIIDRNIESNQITYQWICLFYEEEKYFIDTFLMITESGKTRKDWLLDYMVYTKEFVEVAYQMSNELGKKLVELLINQPNYRLLFATGRMKINEF